MSALTEGDKISIISKIDQMSAELQAIKKALTNVEALVTEEEIERLHERFQQTQTRPLIAQSGDLDSNKIFFVYDAKQDEIVSKADEVSELYKEVALRQIRDGDYILKGDIEDIPEMAVVGLHRGEFKENDESDDDDSEPEVSDDLNERQDDSIRDAIISLKNSDAYLTNHVEDDEWVVYIDPENPTHNGMVLNELQFSNFSDDHRRNLIRYYARMINNSDIKLDELGGYYLYLK